MTHKADSEFFERKRQWSTWKDEILGCYLTAYLAKIMTLRKAVLLVDGFAGPGAFGDGEPGSPLIICDVVGQTLEKNLQSRQDVRVVCIEREPTLFERLARNLEPHSFATAHNGTFSAFANRISAAAKTKSLFLYVDPFTVEGLVWAELDQIFEGLDAGNSVEILMNLNSASFVRRGLAAMKYVLQDMEDEQGIAIDAEFNADPRIDTLNAVAGGDWWQQLVSDAASFPDAVVDFTAEFSDRLKGRFKHVVSLAVKAAPHHKVAKYYLVFGTRRIDGVVLMNDQMLKGRDALAEMAKPDFQPLFETRSEELVPDLTLLPDEVLKLAIPRMPRKDLIARVVEENFLCYQTTQIRSAIEGLLKSGDMQSATGSARINKDVEVWATPGRLL